MVETGMFKLLLSLIMLLVVIPARADNTMAYPQTADRFVISAVGTGKGDVKIILTAMPVINACGKFSAIPLTPTYDHGAVDIRIGDYTFNRPLGTGAKDCGPVNKVAAGQVTLRAKDLSGHHVNMLRLWSGPDLDTYYFTRAGDKVFLNAPQPPTRVFLK